ncbi:hypothetical protein Cpir12675_005402 [Ceratocystis pirilliformis]|uniref:Bud22 domain-containing protein n=1 Tax=Ceratocystis pirilliformis TaxID=259994 RepID=A0ABR3YQ27_9PEZI
MVKRKRETLTIEKALAKARHEFFRATKTAKGFERQRLAKRLREPGVTPEKKKRLEMEVTILKSLDLEQTATAHLYSVLNRIPTIAQHPELPEFVRRGVPKPDISEEQKSALHAVTSSLFSRPNVRQTVDATLEEVCMVLDVQQPEKKRSRSRKADFSQQGDKDKTPVEGKQEPEQENDKKPLDRKNMSAKEQRDEIRRKLLEGINMEDISGDNDDEEEEHAEFDGFSDNDNSNSDDSQDEGDEAELDSDAQEAAIAKMDALLGGSSSEDDSNDDCYDTMGTRKNRVSILQKGPSKTIRVRDISVSVSPEGSSASESESESEDDTLQSKANAKSKAKSRATAASKATSNSTFLPSLMGGYVSGSESEASDLDIAPARKNRLGQRQRQAIWEKRYGEKAKHRQAEDKKPASTKEASWDAKRGAVFDGGKPWKKGIDPFAAADAAAKANKPKKVENGNGGEGGLHPSWEARKKTQQKIKIGGPPTAKKITFDD